MSNYILNHSGSEIDTLLDKIDNIDLSTYAKKLELPTKVSELTNDTGYLTQHQDISSKVDKTRKIAGIDLQDDITINELAAALEVEGQRGTGILKVTTAPTSYTTMIGGFMPEYRIELSTVILQSGVDEVLVGDLIAYSYNQYLVGYVDSSYAYLGAETSIRGVKGDTPTAAELADDMYDELELDTYATLQTIGTEPEYRKGVLQGQYYYTPDKKKIGIKISEASSSDEGLNVVETYSDTEIDAKIAAIGREDYCNSLPPTIYTGLNGETKIYYRNIFTPNYLMHWGQYTNATNIREYDDFVSLKGTAAATKSIAYRTFDRFYKQIEDGETSVVINSTPPASQTMLLLGDSFISQNYIGPDLKALFSSAGSTLTLIGSKGTSSNPNEGYAGWKYTDFVDTSKSASNNFWNSQTNSFDFSYYMSQNGYSKVDSIYIQLGTNDVSAAILQSDFSVVIAAAQTIVSSILSYNSNIKIYLGLTVMPTLDSTVFATKYNGIGVPWLMRLNMQRLNAALINAFKSNASVRIVATNCILDSVEDIKDNVHPNSTGYQKMAQQLYYTMMS